MSSKVNDSKNKNLEKNKKINLIKVAILAEEPMGWGSGKHFFPIILNDYSWKKDNKIYKFNVEYIFDKDILMGRLNKSEFDVLLVPGGGVGDGQSIMKGFNFSIKVRKWKKMISKFIKEGGGYVGICGGTALLTDLKTQEKKPQTFLERQYNKSSLGVSCISSYYRTFAFPIFYPFQKNYPEKIGAAAYVFSFAPGKTTDGLCIHTAGVPIDFQISKDNPIFSDFAGDTQRIRWWGGPGLIVPKNPERKVKILARYPAKELSEDQSTKIHAWRYAGGISGLILAFFKALKFIKKEKDSLKNVFLYTYYMAGNWQLTDKIIQLDYSNKPSITAEIYPNENEGRILLCTSHPEYMIWTDGFIVEMENKEFTCLGHGLHKWQGIAPLSKNAEKELIHTWWIVRRFVAWAAKVPDEDLPPIKEETMKKEISNISENIFWDGSLFNQMKNI
jgi:putative intracellular protease/amidase